MNDETMRALKMAVRYYCRYENSNPDVGMGPSAESVVQDVLHLTCIAADASETKTLERTAQKALR
jgi:hypothetical protein